MRGTDFGRDKGLKTAIRLNRPDLYGQYKSGRFIDKHRLFKASFIFGRIAVFFAERYKNGSQGIGNKG